jgi:hypothetical protein
MMDRRSFLRFLGIGAGAAVAAPIIKPKSFFFFDSAKVWKPEPLWTPGDTVVLGADYGPDGAVTWCARLGKWTTGPLSFGQLAKLPNGMVIATDNRGRYLTTTYTMPQPDTPLVFYSESQNT